jgi:hypothetical protein
VLPFVIFNHKAQFAIVRVDRKESARVSLKEVKLTVLTVGFHPQHAVAQVNDVFFVTSHPRIMAQQEGASAEFSALASLCPLISLFFFAGLRNFPHPFHPKIADVAAAAEKS